MGKIKRFAGNIDRRHGIRLGFDADFIPFKKRFHVAAYNCPLSRQNEFTAYGEKYDQNDCGYKNHVRRPNSTNPHTGKRQNFIASNHLVYQNDARQNNAHGKKRIEQNQKPRHIVLIQRNCSRNIMLFAFLNKYVRAVKKIHQDVKDGYNYHNKEKYQKKLAKNIPVYTSREQQRTPGASRFIFIVRQTAKKVLFAFQLGVVDGKNRLGLF